MTRKKGHFSQAKEGMTMRNELRLLRGNAAALVALAETVLYLADRLKNPRTPTVPTFHHSGVFNPTISAGPDIPDEAAIVERWVREQDEPLEEVTVELAGVPWTGR